MGKINRVEVNANEAFAELGAIATATPREESTRRERERDRGIYLLKCVQAELGKQVECHIKNI